MLPCCTVFSAVACCRLRSGWRVVALPSFVDILCCVNSLVRLPISISRGLNNSIRTCFERLARGRRRYLWTWDGGVSLGVVCVAFAVGGVEELPWAPGVVGWWCWKAVLAATVGSLSCCGFRFLCCLAGPPGALALALYLKHARDCGVEVLAVWWACDRRSALVRNWRA